MSQIEEFIKKEKIDDSKTIFNLGKLTSYDLEDRQEAINHLAILYPDKRMVPLVSHMLADREYHVRAEAAKGLGNLEERKATALLGKRLLVEKHYLVKIELALALARFKDPKAAPFIVKALKEEKHEKVISALAIAAKETGAKASASILADNLNNPEFVPHTKANIAKALGEFGGAKAEKALLDCVKGWDLRSLKESTHVRESALALGRLKSKKAVPHLIRLLDRAASLSLHTPVVSALGNIADTRAKRAVFRELVYQIEKHEAKGMFPNIVVSSQALEKIAFSLAKEKRLNRFGVEEMKRVFSGLPDHQRGIMTFLVVSDRKLYRLLPKSKAGSEAPNKGFLLNLRHDALDRSVLEMVKVLAPGMWQEALRDVKVNLKHRPKK
jgi:HEAT repeat protein